MCVTAGAGHWPRVTSHGVTPQHTGGNGPFVISLMDVNDGMVIGAVIDAFLVVLRVL
jgi:hypothetical protein